MSKPKKFPDQEQKEQPGKQYKMHPKPEIVQKGYKGSGKLEGKVALITGGDSGIGRSIAVHFAREGAKVAVIYFNEDKDAKKTQELVEKEGSECFLLEGDLTDRDFCKSAPKKVKSHFGKLDILVNNAAVQYAHNHLENIEDDELEMGKNVLIVDPLDSAAAINRTSTTAGQSEPTA